MNRDSSQPVLRAAIYTRVSTEEQVDGFSLSAQAEACRRYAEQKGWQVSHLYEERGRSGKSAQRPEFQQMIRDAEAKLFDVVIVHKIDRFSRSLLDLMTYFKHLNDRGVSFVSVSEDQDYTTPNGRLMLNMIGAVAQWYLDNLSMETKKGKKERARQGGWNGTLAFGYTNLKRLRQLLIDLSDGYKAGLVPEAEYSHKAQLIEDMLDAWSDRPLTAAIPCPFNAEGVRLMYSMYATGHYSDQAIAELLNASGYRTTGQRGENPFGKDTVRDMLQNRFYLGETSYKARKRGRSAEETIPGNHPPLISEALFNRCQEIRQQRAGHWGTGSSQRIAAYPLSTLLYCLECGSRWSGWLLKSKRRYRDPARQRGLHCTGSKSVPASDLEQQAEAILFDLQLPEDWRARILAGLQTERPEVQQVRRTQNELNARMERLRNLYLMGDLEQAEFQQQRDTLQRALDSLPIVDVPMHDLERAAELLQDTQKLWAHATVAEREQWFRAVFHKLYVRDGVIKIVEPTRIMWALLSHIYEVDTWFGDDGHRTHLRYAGAFVVPVLPLDVIQQLLYPLLKLGLN